MNNITLQWDRPMNSIQAAKYHLTRGFIAIELYHAILRQIVDAIDGENDCPFCGNDLRKQHDCKNCSIDHLSEKCFHDGCHTDDCIVIMAQKELKITSDAGGLK